MHNTTLRWLAGILVISAAFALGFLYDRATIVRGQGLHGTIVARDTGSITLRTDDGKAQVVPLSSTAVVLYAPPVIQQKSDALAVGEQVDVTMDGSGAASLVQVSWVSSGAPPQ